MDQISGLPKTILHDILSRLPNKDRAMTMLLSKEWKETWSTFPVLSSCWSDKHSWQQRKVYLDYVTKTFLRFRDQGLAIKELKVILMNRYCDKYLLRNLDLWMKLAIEGGMEVRELCLFGDSVLSKNQRYTFPAGFLEAKLLSKLKLEGGVRFDQVVLNHSIKNFSLRELHLNSVLFGDEGIIEHLISRCPLIEQITLESCYVSVGGLTVRRRMKSLSMSGMKKLKGVKVQGIQEVSIDAPNLENLSYSPDNSHAPFKLNFDSCRNLRRLELLYCWKNVIDDKWLLELFSKFHFLESLKLNKRCVSERINISSAQLKVLELSYCSNLEEVNIDAPNLLSFVYHGRGSNMPVIYFLRSSSKLEFNANITVDFQDLCNLREIIQNFKPHNVLASLSLFIDDEPHVDELIPDVLQLSSPPPSVKHLNLKRFPTNKDLYLPLVNLLLSGCCPETISFGLDCDSCEAFAEQLLLEPLMGRNRDKCYCSSGQTKCWWHDLKNVQVTRSVETIYSKNKFDELYALPPEEIINFRIEL